MDFENSVVKINVKYRIHDFNHPLNLHNINNSSGTGMFISNNLILTCYHVIKSAVNIEIVYKQINNINATIKHIFPDDDLAIIELEKNVDDAIILGTKIIDTKKIGEVLTVGFPLSSTSIKITKGVISGFQDALIQTDATLNSGNSGGPLLMLDTDGQYKIIGVNVSKLTGKAESTGFVVPIYRFIIEKKHIEANKKIINKPVMYFSYQKLEQEQIKKKLLNGEDITKKTGVRITLINPNYYYYNVLKSDLIIKKINKKNVDNNGFLKFDFYPEICSIDDIGLWFSIDDPLEFELYDPKTKETKTETIILKRDNGNLFEYYDLESSPKYYIENNGLILSILSGDHMKNIKKLDLSLKQFVGLFDRLLYQRNLFTVYLADINFSSPAFSKSFTKYPIGDIIIEINDKKFDNYENFLNVVSEPIKKITTITQDIYYI